MPENSTISSNFSLDHRVAHAHEGALQKDVLAAGEIRMKAGGDLDQRADAALDVAALRGSGA